MQFTHFGMSIAVFVIAIHLVASLDSSADHSDGTMDRDRKWKWKGHHHHHHSAEEVVLPSIVDQAAAASSILNAIFTGVTSIAKVAAIEKALSNEALPPKAVYPENIELKEVKPNPYNGWVFDEVAKSWKYKLETNGWIFDEVTKSWKYKLETNGWVFDDASYSWKYKFTSPNNDWVFDEVSKSWYRP